MSLSSEDKTRLDSLFDSNLHYHGKSKLEKMPDVELQYLMSKFGCDANGLSSDSKTKVVHQILHLKEQRASKRKKEEEEERKRRIEEFEASVQKPEQIDQPERPDTPSPPPPADASPKSEDEPVEVFVKQPSVKVVAFNVLKLQMTKAGVADQWLAVVATFATFDVVVMQEIPHTDEKMRKQVEFFAQILEMHSKPGVSWTYHVSEPSGSKEEKDKGDGRKKTYMERHAVFVRSPAKIVKVSQLPCIQGENGSVNFDYDPMTVLIESPVFEDVLGESRMLITSVHMPPASKERRDARDRQLKALLRGYPLDSASRMETAFTKKGAKDADNDANKRAFHMVMGDFNVAPQIKDKEGNEVYGLEKNGWAPPLIPETVATSSGQRCYDNIILDSESFHSVSKRCFVHAEVLELAMFQKAGSKGVSDHSPIAVAFKKAPQTKEAQKKRIA